MLAPQPITRKGNAMRALQPLFVSIIVLGIASAASAADKTCTAVNKAGELGAKQSRIHNVADLLRSANPKPGAKEDPLGEKMTHSIVIDQTHYMSLDGTTFSTDTLPDKDQRSLMAGLTLFIAIDEGCKSLGKSTLAGRSVDMYEHGSTKTADDAHYKFWIDSKTGLPLKGTENVPQPEVNLNVKKGKPSGDVKYNKTERIVNTVGFVFGDVVKAPKLSGAKGIMGQKGEVDAATAQMLKAIVTSDK
jgi:hypothetical protein